MVVDDETMISGLVAQLLRAQGFEVETARDAAHARTVLEDFDPDIAIIDIDLGEGPSGVDLAHFVVTELPHVAILLLTQYRSPELLGYHVSGLPESVGYLSKASVVDPSQLIAAIESVLRESGPRFSGDSMIGPFAGLTERQLEIVRLLAMGYTTNEIARQRATSASAAEQMITAIYRRLGLPGSGEVNQRAEAVRLFVEHVGLPDRPHQPPALP